MRMTIGIGGPHDNRPRRRLWIALVAGIALLVVLALLITVLTSPCSPPDRASVATAPQGPEAGAPDADLDAVAPQDLAAPDRRRNRRRQRGATRLIGNTELIRMQRLHGASIRLCYQRAARHRSGAVARANVTVDLADHGRIRSVQVDAGKDQELAGCIRRAVRGWRFSQTLKAQQVRFPVLFR